MKNKSIEETAMEEYDKILDEEIKELDRDISALNIEFPENLRKKLSKSCGLNLRRGKVKFNFAKKVASVLFITIITTGIMSYIVVTQPKAVIAVKNVFRLFSIQPADNDAINISLKEADNFSIGLPHGFSETIKVENKSFIRYKYENAGNYIEITIYSTSYNLYLDDENDIYEEDEINGNNCYIFSKNTVTTIVYKYNDNFIEIESNLPETDIKQVAESINFN